VGFLENKKLRIFDFRAKKKTTAWNQLRCNLAQLGFKGWM
jgi:hypothetical protein